MSAKESKTSQKAVGAYNATLFRGWEIVHLHYTLEDGALLLHRKRTWKGQDTQRVELASLTGEIRHIWARQPAYAISTIIAVVALLILAIDAMVHGVGAGGRPISWLLWTPLLLLTAAAIWVRTKTRRPAQWTHFVGKEQGKGMYVLRDLRAARQHDSFIVAVKREAGFS